MGSRIIFTIGAFVLVGIIQFVVGLGDNYLASLFSAAVLAALTFGLWRIRETDSDTTWDLYLPVVAALAGIALGEAASWLVEVSRPPYNWVAVLAGAIVLGWALFLQRRRNELRCDCCRKPLGKGRQWCPRGDHWVCAGCWLPERIRCTDCERLRTPLLELLEVEWWTHRLGERVRTGKCSRCNRQASERDLRRCEKCTWPMCLHCWDMENGQCLRCDWVVPDLPESLAMRVESD